MKPNPLVAYTVSQSYYVLLQLYSPLERFLFVLVTNDDFFSLSRLCGQENTLVSVLKYLNSLCT